MTSSGPTPPTSDSSVAAYEELRTRILAGSSASGRFDVLLLIREGIAAWMTHGSRRVVPHVLPASDPALGVAATPAVAADIHSGLVLSLASMALANRREQRA